VIVVLPYPVSANRYWRSFVPKNHTRAVTIPSEEARNYRSRTAWLVKVSGIKKPFDVPVEVRFRLVPATRVCMDLDNCLKVAIDALKGVAFEDDSLVHRIIAERAEPAGKGNARLEVEVRVFEAVAAPLFARAVA
jgi:crossover junction endodeoxyribonuclease RusA